MKKLKKLLTELSELCERIQKFLIALAGLIMVALLLWKLCGGHV